MGSVYPLNSERMSLKQAGYPSRLVRLSSLIEYPKVNLDAYCPQRRKTEHGGHAIEYLAFEPLDIDLDNCGGLVPRQHQGVRPGCPHHHGRCFIRAREVVARGSIPAFYRKPRLAVLIGKGYRDDLP